MVVSWSLISRLVGGGFGSWLDLDMDIYKYVGGCRVGLGLGGKRGYLVFEFFVFRLN